MNHFFLIFWSVLIFASIAWYGFLLFYIGFKGGREIKTMTQTAASKQKQNGTDQPKRQE